jgi:RimJ/RimL family protein N-acetyltransferase
MTATSGVELRPVEDRDLPILYGHQADPIATEMAAFPARDRPEFMAHWAGILVDDSNIARAIVADDQVVGTVMSWLEGDHREVGLWIGRAFWGRGYGTGAMAQFVAEVAERPIVAHIAQTNVRSQRMVERCGFRRGEAAEVDGVLEWIYRLD